MTANHKHMAEQVLELILAECRYWHSRDEARRGNFAILYAAARELVDQAQSAEPVQGAATYKLGDLVRKKSGSQWHGIVVGTYSTALTPEGYAVESATESGSVQIYPVSALEPWKPECSPAE
jgi:dihydrofolate reductase (trimethoprim resistance protein)